MVNQAVVEVEEENPWSGSLEGSRTSDQKLAESLLLMWRRQEGSRRGAKRAARGDGRAAGPEVEKKIRGLSRHGWCLTRQLLGAPQQEAEEEVENRKAGVGRG